MDLRGKGGERGTGDGKREGSKKEKKGKGMGSIEREGRVNRNRRPEEGRK